MLKVSSSTVLYSINSGKRDWPLLGIDAKLQRIYGSLEMDTGKAQRQLQWSVSYIRFQALSLMVSSKNE